MNLTIIKWGYWILGCVFGYLLCLIVSEVFPQTCSPIGTYTYCDSGEGSTIVAPLGPSRGIIIGPGTRSTTYSTLKTPRAGEVPPIIYFDSDRDVPAYKRPSWMMAPMRLPGGSEEQEGLQP